MLRNHYFISHPSSQQYLVWLGPELVGDILVCPENKEELLVFNSLGEFTGNSFKNITELEAWADKQNSFIDSED